MNDYCVFVIGDDGHVMFRYDLVCASEEEARRLAKHLVTDRDVELWQRAQKLATFRHQPLQ